MTETYKLKLTDVTYKDQGTISTGTCELCMGTQYAVEPWFHFQVSNGERIKVAGFEYQAWTGYLDTVREVNVAAFAAWIAGKDFTSEDLEDMADSGYGWLDDLIYDYEDEVEGI